MKISTLLRTIKDLFRTCQWSKFKILYRQIGLVQGEERRKIARQGPPVVTVDPRDPNHVTVGHGASPLIRGFTSSGMKDEKLFYISRDIAHCDMDCPYFITIDDKNLRAHCSLLKEDLDYYDSYLAACQNPLGS